MALFPDRITRRERMYLNTQLRREEMGDSEDVCVDLRHFPTTQLCNALEVRDLPSEVLDDLHGSQKFL